MSDRRESLSNEVRRTSVNWSATFAMILSLAMVAAATGGSSVFARKRYSDMFTNFFFVVVVFSFVTTASFFVFQDMMSSAIMYFLLSGENPDATSEDVKKVALVIFSGAVLVLLSTIAVFYYAFPAYRFMVAYITVLVFMSLCIIATKMFERGKAGARDPALSADDWLSMTLDPRKSFGSPANPELCSDGNEYDGISGWDVFVSKLRVFLGLEKDPCPNSESNPLWLWIIAPVLGVGTILFAATVLEDEN